MNGWSRSKKMTVEQAGESLSIQKLTNMGLFKRGPCAVDTLRLAGVPGNADVLIGVWFYHCEEDGGLYLQVDEGVALPPEKVREVEDGQSIALDSTECFYGGRRYWFLCPRETNGEACGRRVSRLYLPPGEKLFGCRQCFDLTYESVQKHDSRVDALMRDETALDEISQNAQSQKTRDLLLAMRAYNKLFDKDIKYFRGLRNKKALMDEVRRSLQREAS
ncbi:hypothetical protein ACFLU6_04655 [Acidobacteriota bacterium]